MSSQDSNTLRNFSWHRRRILAPAVLLFLGVAVFFLFGAALAIIFGSSSSSTEHVYSDQPGPEDFVIFMTVSELGNPDVAEFALSGIDFPIDAPARVASEEELCIESLAFRPQERSIESQTQYEAMSRESLTSDEWIEFGSAYRRSSIPQGMLVSSRDDICYAQWGSASRDYPTHPGASIVADGEQPKSVFLPIQATRNIYYYPFDRRVVSANIQLNAVVEDVAAARNMPLVVSASILDSEWDEIVGFERYVDPDSGAEELQMTIELRRPIPKQILAGVLISIMIVFVLLLNALQDTANYLEAAIGITFGLWGIQAAMKPQFIAQNTIVDDAILVIYLLLGVTILFRFIIRPAEERANEFEERLMPDTPEMVAVALAAARMFADLEKEHTSIDESDDDIEGSRDG